MKFQILLFALITTLLMVSSTSRAQEDDYNNQMCLGTIPKSFFGNERCYECRETTSNIGFGTGITMVGIKLLAVFETFCCMNRSCNESCCFTWGMPAINACCDSRSLCLANSVCLGSTILTGVGVATGICAWNPLCTQEGWNPKLKRNNASPQLLNMQMVEDKNNN